MIFFFILSLPSFQSFQVFVWYIQLESNRLEWHLVIILIRGEQKAKWNIDRILTCRTVLNTTTFFHFLCIRSRISHANFPFFPHLFSSQFHIDSVCIVYIKYWALFFPFLLRLYSFNRKLKTYRERIRITTNYSIRWQKPAKFHCIFNYLYIIQFYYNSVFFFLQHNLSFVETFRCNEMPLLVFGKSAIVKCVVHTFVLSRQFACLCRETCSFYAIKFNWKRKTNGSC